MEKIDYLMVNVSEMNASVAFYRDVLGLTLRMESPGWTEFETGTTTLALHMASGEGMGHGKGEPVPGTCLMGFSVQNLDETVAELQSRGARFVMLPTDQSEEGIRLAVCIDPDGLAITFAEPLQSAE